MKNIVSLQTGKSFDIILPKVYRYMGAEYVDIFFNEGKLRLSSFSKFINYPDEIRGDKNEGHGSVIGIGENNFQFMAMTSPQTNGYLLCGSLINSNEIQNIFDCDSGFVIQDVLGFANAISNSIIGVNKLMQGFCNYQESRFIQEKVGGLSMKQFTNSEGKFVIDNKTVAQANQLLGNGAALVFLKEKKYQNQLEYRFVWSIATDYYKIQDYIDIECKEAIQFCERIG